MKKIAILNLTRMGDLIMTSPMIQSLKDQNTETEIHLIVVDKFAQVAEGLGVDKVIGLDYNLLTTLATEAKNSQKILGTLDYFRKTISELKKHKYDEIHNITHTTISALIVSQMNGNVASGITLDKSGYRRIENNWGRYFFAGNLNRGLNPFHLADVQLGISKGIGKGYRPKFLISESGKEQSETLSENIGINRSKSWIGIQCGASDKSKQWDAESFAEAAKRILINNDVEFLLFGTSNEHELVSKVENIIGQNVYNLAGKTDIPTLAAFLSECDLLISNDTGTMHLADAVGTKTIVLTLGNALSDETAPYGQNHIVLEPAIECFPCSFRTNCPHFNCHGYIKPVIVATIATEILYGREINPSKIQARVRISRTSSDNNGLFRKTKINGTLFSPDEIIKEIYRKILFKDLSGKNVEYDIDLRLSEKYLANGHSGEFLHLIKQTKIIAEKLNQGIEVSNELKKAVSQNGNSLDPVALSNDIEKLYIDIYDNYLNLEQIRPILLLLRFDQENIPLDGVIDQIHATRDSFIRTKDLVIGFRNELEKVVVKPNRQNNSYPISKNQGKVISSPFAKFVRPRFSSEQLTVILPVSNYFVQNEIARSLKRMGHRVIPLVFKNNPNAMEQLLEYSLQADFLITVNHLAFDKNGEFENVLEKIRLPYVSWFVDRPGFILLDYTIPEGDFGSIYTWERTTIPEINGYGYDRVKFLPLACDDNLFGKGSSENESDRLIWVADSNVLPAKKWFKKAGIDDSTRLFYEKAVENQINNRIDPIENVRNTSDLLGIDIQTWNRDKLLNFASAIALAATSKSRGIVAENMVKYGLEIYGDANWNELVNTGSIFERVSYEEELPILYRKGIHLNSTSYQMPTAVNQRVFDIPLSGGILITDAQSDMENLFKKDEYLSYNSVEEAIDLVEFATSNRAAAKITIQKAAQRIIEEHTYVQRLKKIIAEISDRYSIKTVSV